jgi:hypothetical protein
VSSWVRFLVLSALLALSGAVLFAQPQSSTGSNDVDNLFNGNDSAQTAAPPTASGSSTTEDLPGDSKLYFFGSLNLYGELGAGLSRLQTGSSLGHDVGGSMTTSLGFEVRPAANLRIRGTLSYSFPGTAAEAQSIPLLSEMFFDYSVLDAVFFRVGIFGYTWGNSQFFQFGNLPSRGLPGWNGVSNLPSWEQTNLATTVTTQNYPVSFKMNVPIGQGGLTLLSRFDLQNYFADPSSPSPQNAGYGAEYDLVTGPIDWTIGGFYQVKLTPRSLLSMKTTLFGFDLSAEATIAFPVAVPSGGGWYVGGVLQRIYPTAVIGIYREWSDLNLKLYGEYAYNGERDPGVSWLPDETGPGGHNSAIGVRVTNVAKSGVSLNLLWQQNWSDGSGLVAPFIEVSPFKTIVMQIGLPVSYGSDNSEVMGNRLIPGSLQAELLILLKLSTSFNQ